MKKFWNKIVCRFNNISNENDKDMPLSMRNYVLILIGAVIILVGFVLMSGGGEATADEFHYEIFSWRRITLAPLLVVFGFAFEIYAILKR